MILHVPFTAQNRYRNLLSRKLSEKAIIDQEKSDGKETGDLSRSLLRHVDTETLINRKQYVQHVENSLAYATGNQIDTLHRSKSPVGKLGKNRDRKWSPTLSRHRHEKYF